MRRIAKTGRLLALLAALLIPLATTAQEHANARILRNRDNSAGRAVAGVSKGLLLYSPDPAYTKAAREAKVKGTVVLYGMLGADGCLQDVKVVRSLGYGLDESAVYAVQRWRFDASQNATVPTAKRVRVEVNFDPAWSRETTDLPGAMCGQQPLSR